MGRPAIIVSAAVLVLAACGQGETATDAEVDPIESERQGDATSISPIDSTGAADVTSTSDAPGVITVPSAPVYELAPSVDAPPNIELTNPGQEPRAVLEYDLAVGDMTTNEIVVTFGTSQTFNGQLPTGSDLTVTARLETTVLEIVADGFIVETTILDATVGSSNAAIVESLADLYAFLPGLSTYTLMAPSGAVIADDGSSFDTFYEAAGQEVDFSPGSVVSPFPSEPVGVGATWVVVATIAEEFVSLEQRTTYEVTSIDGQLLEMSITVEQTLLNIEALGAGLEDPDVSYVAVGTGSITIDRSTAMPQHSDTSLVQTIEIRGISEGVSVEIITTNIVGTRLVTESVARAS